MAGEVIPIRTSGSASQSSFQEQDGSTWVKFAPGQSPHRPNGGGGGDMSDWKQSVEDRLTDLRDDYRELRGWGLAAVGLILAAGAYAYLDVNSEVRSISKSIGEVSTVVGKIDGRTERLDNAIDDNSTRSPRSE